MQQARTCYTTTRGNMMIDQNTRVICQGFTGKQVGIRLLWSTLVCVCVCVFHVCVCVCVCVCCTGHLPQ